MKPQISATSLRPLVSNRVPSEAATVRLAPRVHYGSSIQTLGRQSTVPLALASATVFPPLREAMGNFESRTVVTEKGGVVLTFILARRYAILTAEPDGELVLTLTDRASSEEADVDVVDNDVPKLAERICRFLNLP